MAFTCLSSSLFPCLVCHFRLCYFLCLFLRQRYRFFLDFRRVFQQLSVSIVHLARIQLSRFPMFRILPFFFCDWFIYVCLFEWFVSSAILPMTPDGSPVSCLLFIFQCSCTLHSKNCSLIVVLVRSVISLLLGLFCGHFLVFSAIIPLYFIHSRLSSDITHYRLWSVLGSVTSCVPLLLFVVSACHSR